MEYSVIGQRSLYSVGITFIFFSIIAILKFAYVPIYEILGLFYVVTLVMAGVFLILASFGYFWGAKRYSSSPSYLSAILIISVGIGYILLATSLESMDILLMGIALTIIKPALFFYSFTTMYFFFEIEHGKMGGIGSLLILFFSSSHHFFAFSPEFYRTLPGAIFTSIAAIGYMMQGFSIGIASRHEVSETTTQETEETRIRMPITRPF